MVGPGPVRQLDGAFLFGHELFVAYLSTEILLRIDPHATTFAVDSHFSMTRQEFTLVRNEEGGVVNKAITPAFWMR
jgi:hypothetical protein